MPWQSLRTLPTRSPSLRPPYPQRLGSGGGVNETNRQPASEVKTRASWVRHYSIHNGAVYPDMFVAQTPRKELSPTGEWKISFGR